MSLLLIRKSASPDAWIAALKAEMSDLEVRVWPDTEPVEEVEFVLTWAAERGTLARFPRLKAIFSLGAGVDHILDDPTVPKHLPVIRMIEPSLTQGMTQYVLLAVLRQHRDLTEYERQQRKRIWRKRGVPNLAPPQIGVMGMGELGSAAARALTGLGYDVAGWGRKPRPTQSAQEEISYFHGHDQLDAFLARTNILICLLPRTPETEGILDEADEIIHPARNERRHDRRDRQRSYGEGRVERRREPQRAHDA